MSAFEHRSNRSYMTYADPDKALKFAIRNSQVRNSLHSIMSIGLYVVTTANKSMGRRHVDVARAALRGGCRWIQYREKDRALALRSDQPEAILKLVRQYGAKLVINDWVDLAVSLGADGLHIGRSDEVLAVARSRFGGLIGVSAGSPGEAVEAARWGADYVGFGPVFPTASKADASPPTGLVGLAEARRSIDVPIVAIGGISVENVSEVIAAGADGAAVIAAIASAGDMEAAAARLTALITGGND